MKAKPPTIPIMRPRLPTADRLLPYLKAIDSAQIYSNYGPLTHAFEDRLAARLGLSGDCVTTVANATSGLALALAAAGARPGTLCVMPAWTFVASAHAATLAGLVPYFVDVDAKTWALDPEAVSRAITGAPGTVGAVMPVMPFGSPIDMAAWDRFRSHTRLPVVIDAAAGFDSLDPSSIPAVVSLHATKALGVGEGGFVASTDAALVREVRRRANFGFAGSREASAPATNAKLSEYHAAVGLAALDEWPRVRREWMSVGSAFRHAIAASDRLELQEGFGHSWIASTCVVRMVHSDAVTTARLLERAGVETRRWWGDGAHEHRATAAFPRAPLTHTEALARSTLGVPFFRGLTSQLIRQVVEVAHEARSAVREG